MVKHTQTMSNDNGKLKLAKNQANAKEHPETEL